MRFESCAWRKNLILTWAIQSWVTSTSTSDWKSRPWKSMRSRLEADPNNEEIKTFYPNKFLITARPDEYLQVNQRFFNRGPDFIYYLEKRMAQEAERLVEQTFQKEPGSPWALAQRALLLALQGKQQEAEAAIPLILKARKNRGYHHVTYNIARIYALAGKSDEAVKWLRVTAKKAFPATRCLRATRSSIEFVRIQLSAVYDRDENALGKLSE